MTAPALPPARRTAERRGGLVVEGSALPAWVRRWGERSGRLVVVRPVDALTVGSAAGASVLIPRSDPTAGRPPRVAAVVRSLPDDSAVLADALDAAVNLDGVLIVFHGVPLSFGERSVGRDDALERGRELLEEARASVRGRGVDVPVHVTLVRAWPHEIVGELLDAHLLVLGGPRAGSGGRIGLVAASALRHAPCAVLLSPRPAFPSPQPGPSR